MPTPDSLPAALDELERRQDEIDRLRQRVAELEAELEATQEIRDDLQKASADWSSICERQKERIRELESIADAAIRNMAEFRDDRNSLRQELALARKKFRRGDQYHVDLEKDVAAYDTHMAAQTDKGGGK